MEVAAVTGEELQGDKINKSSRSKTSSVCSKVETKDIQRNPPSPRQQLCAGSILKGLQLEDKKRNLSTEVKFTI